MFYSDELQRRHAPSEPRNLPRSESHQWLKASMREIIIEISKLRMIMRGQLRFLG